MRKSVYPFCVLFFIVLLSFPSCRTTAAAAQPQEDASIRKEQLERPEPEQKPDAVTGATHQARRTEETEQAETEPVTRSAAVSAVQQNQTVQQEAVMAQSDAPVPEHPHQMPLMQQNEEPALITVQAPAPKEKPVISNMPTAPENVPLAAIPVSADDEKTTGTEAATDAEIPDKSVENKQEPKTVSLTALIPAHTIPSAAPSSDAVAMTKELSPAQQEKSSVPSAQTSLTLKPKTAFLPEADALTRIETDTADSTDETEVILPESTPVQTYEESLAALISDFEDQGGSHGYEPPRSFHDEMLDLFSPRIFSVALSKEPETERKVSVSRSAAVEEKQRLEIVYPGHGWVYVGEQTSQPGLRYEQRKLQDNTSIFTFSAEKRGNYVLHFSYFDVFTDDFITDAVAVSVGSAKSSAAKTTVRAPDYQTKDSGDDEAPVAKTKTENFTQAAPQKDVKQPAIPVPVPQPNVVDTGNGKEKLTEPLPAAISSSEKEAPLTPEDLLQKARTAINTADAASALQFLDVFFTAATKNLDEGWFLRGRAYELNGTARNIRLALNSYKILTEAFPQSKYWAEADARIRYITNFYINIQ